jgi:hypothetical protein
MTPPAAIPLLLQRSGRGLGPRIPVRLPSRVVIVEGLAPMDKVVLHISKNGSPMEHMEFDNGETYLDEPIPEGSVVRANLHGMDSCVSVWLE